MLNKLLVILLVFFPVAGVLEWWAGWTIGTKDGVMGLIAFVAVLATKECLIGFIVVASALICRWRIMQRILEFIGDATRAFWGWYFFPSSLSQNDYGLLTLIALCIWLFGALISLAPMGFTLTHIVLLISFVACFGALADIIPMFEMDGLDVHDWSPLISAGVFGAILLHFLPQAVEMNETIVVCILTTFALYVCFKGMEMNKPKSA